MSDSPKVTRLVMFKHGVAYVERSGPAEGPFELAFKRDEMNDILKSLAVWVAKGDARVGALSFDAPEDPEAALVSRRLHFEPGGALEGLVRALRGRRVIASDGHTKKEGEIVGYQNTDGGHEPAQRTLILRTREGTLATIDLATVKDLELVEASSRADLAFFLDRSRAATAEDRRVVRVDLSGVAEDLRISYVIPAPVWRVSYRVVAEPGRTMLMAWGIVHNPSEEDLTDVDLTLTTGEPVSFVMDLYNPKLVQRTVVEEKARIAAAPKKFERGRMAKMAMAAPAPSMVTSDVATMGGSFGGGGLDEDTMDGAPTVAGRMADGMFTSAQGAAASADRGEFFEYRVLGKISLKRGGSAMVPLIAAPLEARKERIWRDGTGDNPDLVVTFMNTTNAVLEEGPGVLYDDGIYSGEAMIPFSARGAEVKLAYAKDLAVRCGRRSKSSLSTSGIRLGDQLLIEDQHREQKHELVAESFHGEEVEVIFEMPKVHGRSIDPSHTVPFEETTSYRRYKAMVPPHGRVELTVVERWSDSRHISYDTMAAKDLERWMDGRFLDRVTYDMLGNVLVGWAKARALDTQCGRVEKGRDDAYAKQQKIGEQLAVLKDTGPEGSLRLRYVKELEREQDKVNHCDAEIARLRDEAERMRARANGELADLTRRQVKPEPSAVSKIPTEE